MVNPPPAAVRAAFVFALAYLTAAGVGVFLTRDREFLVYFAVVAALVGVVTRLHRRVGFSPGVLWGLNVLGALHMAGGLVQPPEAWPIEGRRVLYNLWVIPGLLRFDQVVHFYGSAVATWACWQLFEASTRLTRPTPGLAVMAALAGAGLGAVNETLEFLTTRVIPDTNVGGFENTGWDMVANLAGAVTSAGLLVRGAGGELPQKQASRRPAAPACVDQVRSRAPLL